MSGLINLKRRIETLEEGQKIRRTSVNWEQLYSRLWNGDLEYDEITAWDNDTVALVVTNGEKTAANVTDAQLEYWRDHLLWRLKRVKADILRREIASGNLDVVTLTDDEIVFIAWRGEKTAAEVPKEKIKWWRNHLSRNTVL